MTGLSLLAFPLTRAARYMGVLSAPKAPLEQRLNFKVATTHDRFLEDEQPEEIV